MTAPAVEYFEIPGAPGLRFFRCDRYRATLSVTACAERFKTAQVARGDRFDGYALCHACPIGAEHAGARSTFFGPLYAHPICPRCGGGGARMVANRICISDYNRSREFRAGRNAKGTRPVRTHTAARRIGLIIDYDRPGRTYLEIVDPCTAHLFELIRQISRVTPGRLAFCRPTGRNVISTAELAERFEARRPIGTRHRHKPAMASLFGRPADIRAVVAEAIRTEARYREAGRAVAVVKHEARGHGAISDKRSAAVRELVVSFAALASWQFQFGWINADPPGDYPSLNLAREIGGRSDAAVSRVWTYATDFVRANWGEIEFIARLFSVHGGASDDFVALALEKLARARRGRLTKIGAKIGSKRQF